MNVSPATKQTKALVNRFFGIVHKLQAVRIPSSLRGLHWIYSEPSPTKEVLGIQALNEGSAVSDTFERACWKALGESIERYCSASADLHTTYQTEGDDNSKGSLKKYRLFPPTAYDDLPFDPATTLKPLRWIDGIDLIRKSREPVPAQLVFVPYRHFVGEATLDDQDSTGLACGISHEQAIVKGLFEVIERDAFMKWWTGKLPTQRISPRELGQASSDSNILINCLEQSGLETELHIAFPFEGAVVVIAVISCDRAHSPRLVLGLGCSGTFRAALRLALEEGLLSFVGYSERMRVQAQHSLSFDESEFSKPFVYASNPCEGDKAKRRIADLPQDAIRMELLADKNGAFQDLLCEIHDAGWDAIAVDLTTSDIKDAGLHVAKVIVPQAHRLDRRFAHGLFAVDYYQIPHPFP